MRASTDAAGRNAIGTAVEIRLTACGRVTSDVPENESARLKRPPGASRFSSLFYVAAIGGKSPRDFNCLSED